MTDLDALLAGIVDDPRNDLRWLVLADWLEEFDDPRRAELLRLHRWLLGTCSESASHPERAEWHARMVELLREGVTPCAPRRRLSLPGGVELNGTFIPPGSFLMGSPEDEEDHAADEQLHPVALTEGFFLGVSAVTQAQWVAVMGSNPSHFRGDALPVEQVTWEDATAFCDKLSDAAGLAVRLPTEAEWEYAARAGTAAAYHWGDELTAPRCPHPWGLTDGVGRVWEWCADWYARDYYRRSPASDPECRDPDSGLKVIRGGSWYGEPLCRAAAREAERPHLFGDFLGFRVAFDRD